MIQLEVLTGPRAGEHHTFSVSPLTLGREADCDWVLDWDRNISRHHAVLEWTEEQTVLRDLGATQPPLVNGAAFDGECLLESGDELTFGETRIRFKRVAEPHPALERRRSPMELMTAGLAGLLLLGQIFFLFGSSFRWRARVDASVLRPEKRPEVAVPTPTPQAPPPPTDPREVEIEPLPPELLPPPTPTPLPLPTPTPMPRTQDLSTDQQLALARQWILERRWLDADRLLRQILDQEPDRIEARAELARLLGRRSMFRESHQEWVRIRDAVEPDSDLGREAAMEIPLMDRRATLLERPEPTPLPIPTPQPRPVIPALPAVPTPMPQDSGPRPQTVRSPTLILQDIGMQRLDSGTLFEELRLIRVTLRHVAGSQTYAPGDVVVEATFYEEQNGRIFQARIPNPVLRLRINQEVGGGRQIRDLEVSYEVPAGSVRPQGLRFHGVIFRVLANGEEIHALSSPASLLMQR